MVPNHPCYQLHHTRLLSFPVLLTVGIYVVKGEFEARICNERFWNELLSQQLPGLHFKVVGCRTHLPKASALPIALHPVISFSLPRLVPGIFLYVGIPVVNRKFSAKSNPRQSHVFARVSTRSGLSQTTPWMPLSIVPKQARYQLRYTRLFFDTRRILTHTGALCNAFFVAISFGLC